jgi:hypothetical protein
VGERQNVELARRAHRDIVGSLRHAEWHQPSGAGRAFIDRVKKWTPLSAVAPSRKSRRLTRVRSITGRAARQLDIGFVLPVGEFRSQYLLLLADGPAASFRQHACGRIGSVCADAPKRIRPNAKRACPFGRISDMGHQ